MRPTGRVRVTFVRHLANPAAPRAEEIAGGTELEFVQRPSPPLELSRRRFLVARWPDGLMKVREVPVTHEPTDACADVHCHAHGVDEPGPHFRVCGECGHGWPTAEALLADHAALVEQLNADLPPPPWDPEWYAPAVAETDPEEIRACPHCAHDL